MVKKALYVKLQAKPGKEAEVEQFLDRGLSIVQDEPKTVTWYAIKLNDSTYAVFDTFDDESGRDVHLSGEVAKALSARASELLAAPPDIQKLDVLAAKGPAA